MEGLVVVDSLGNTLHNAVLYYHSTNSPVAAPVVVKSPGLFERKSWREMIWMKVLEEAGRGSGFVSSWL